MQGIVPGIHRQFLFTGLRLGLFQRVQDYFSGKPFGPLHCNCMPPLVISRPETCHQVSASADGENTSSQSLQWSTCTSCLSLIFAGGADEPPLHSRIAAALVTSAIGITVSSASQVPALEHLQSLWV